MLIHGRGAWLFAALAVAVMAAGACSGSSHPQAPMASPTVDEADSGTGYAGAATPPGTAIARSGYKTLAVDLSSGDVRELVTAPDTVTAYYSPFFFVASPNGTRLAYACANGVAATPTAVPGGSDQVIGDLCIWTKKGASTPPAASAADLLNPGLLSPDAWSPDGSKLVMRDQLLVGPGDPPVQA